jgi:hypothetical protein
VFFVAVNGWYSSHTLRSKVWFLAVGVTRNCQANHEYTVANDLEADLTTVAERIMTCPPHLRVIT